MKIALGHFGGGDSVLFAGEIILTDASVTVTANIFSVINKL